MTQSALDLDLGTDVLSCTAEELAAVLAGQLREMRAAVPFVSAQERATLRRIMAHDGPLTVGDVFPDFARGTEAHLTLRRLRTAQFIRPAGRDMWERGEGIEVKPFARLVWERLGEAAIFGDAPDAEEALPEAEDVDLSLPEVNEPGSAETARLRKTGAAQWNDDDVLDFLNDQKEAG